MGPRLWDGEREPHELAVLAYVTELQWGPVFGTGKGARAISLVYT